MSTILEPPQQKPLTMAQRAMQDTKFNCYFYDEHDFRGRYQLSHPQNLSVAYIPEFTSRKPTTIVHIDALVGMPDESQSLAAINRLITTRDGLTKLGHVGKFTARGVEADDDFLFPYQDAYRSVVNRVRQWTPEQLLKDKSLLSALKNDLPKIEGASCYKNYPLDGTDLILRQLYVISTPTDDSVFDLVKQLDRL